MQFYILKSKHMQTAIQQTFSNTHSNTVQQPSVFKRFMSWCTSQDENRYGWLGAALATHGCVLTPITLFVIVLAGNNIVFWLFAIVAMMMTLVVNLAAMPTKYTIPVFLFSILIDITLIIACVFAGFNISASFQ
jgi:hypothetical protein